MEEKTTSKEEKIVLGRVINALAANGLGCDEIRAYDQIGFSKPERGYAIMVGAVLLDFKKEYDEIKETLPTLSCIRESLPVSYSHLGYPRYERWYPINESKRDAMAKRVLVKRAINSLETKILEETEEHEINNRRIDSYYKISILDIKIGLFITNPAGKAYSIPDF